MRFERLRAYPRTYLKIQRRVASASVDNLDSMWLPFMRSNGPAWTLEDVVAKLGEVTEFETPIGTWKVRITDGRLTSDPRRAEFLVEPA